MLTAYFRMQKKTATYPLLRKNKEQSDSKYEKLEYQTHITEPAWQRIQKKHSSGEWFSNQASNLYGL